MFLLVKVEKGWKLSHRQYANAGPGSSYTIAEESSGRMYTAVNKQFSSFAFIDGISEDKQRDNNLGRYKKTDKSGGAVQDDPQQQAVLPI